eukprot:TRINITY_DN2140_c0_g1_i1.p1 TRINITY_DN2140_c0_g1~~TRINITY_DN2140_c0_g1_i1.p1  ORF type:complete len:336 (+),score=39.72 TRINITY_DN2140_c0_g1_i1:120-1010(+)
MVGAADAPTKLRSGSSSTTPGADGASGASVEAVAALSGSGRPEYDQYHDKNAFAPYGATDIDNDATAPSGLTPQQCEDRCSADASCMCVSQERATGKCWKRGNCNPNQWVSNYNAGYNVYMKRGSVPPSPGPAPPSTEWFNLRLYIDQSKCLDVKDHQNYNGNKVQIWECISGDNDQFWAAGNRNAEVNAQVRWATHQEKCLDVKDHKTSNGTPLQIWDCIGNDFDQWFYFDSTSLPASAASQFIPRPIGRLRWKEHPSKCVVAQNGGGWNGNSIVLTDCVDGQDAQYWVNDFVER